MSQHWDTYIKNGHFRIEDHFGYTRNGTAHHAVIFVDDGHHDFYYPYNYGSADFKKYIDGLPKGYQPVTADLEEFQGTRRLGGLFMPRAGTWHVKWGLSPSDYQDKYPATDVRNFTAVKCTIRGASRSS